MTTMANSRPITPDEYFQAVELITSQMVDGDCEDVKRTVSNFLNGGADDVFSLSPDMIPLYRIAAILKVMSEGMEKGDVEIDPFILFSLTEEVLKELYPIITESGLEGLKWKPELIFKSPAPVSESVSVEVNSMIEEAAEDAAQLFRKIASGMDVGNEIHASRRVLHQGRKFRVDFTAKRLS